MTVSVGAFAHTRLGRIGRGTKKALARFQGLRKSFDDREAQPFSFCVRGECVQVADRRKEVVRSHVVGRDDPGVGAMANPEQQGEVARVNGVQPRRDTANQSTTDSDYRYGG
ncbi:hypothetical protein SAMN04488564_101904 [Lentzea waywayandensis]|uniref:Uncharacterized protein n=1 Tax=Lentzea waywayandensis TaxID=84724 RepID=A0A1I6D2X2_9PSEU|nr:hypothetical protein [Lentzea waywayandensis]SFQ99667.1 hypothetical protein SAMN04488564_101904 [Lentzea waywayandensis]